MDNFLTDAIWSMLVMSVVPVAAVGAVAGVVALVQAITQVQEASITHLVRFCAFAVVLYLLGPLAFGELVSLLERACGAVEIIGRGG